MNAQHVPGPTVLAAMHLNSTQQFSLRGSVAFAAVIVVLSLAANCPADMVSIVASADGYIDSDNVVHDSAGTVNTQLGGLRDDVGIFEFDLSTIPDGATINSVGFSGFSVQSSFPVGDTVFLQGFIATAPAEITAGDKTAPGVSVAIVESSALPHNAAFSTLLTDISPVQAAADSTEVFGIRSTIDPLSAWIVSSIDQSTNPRPTLTIDFTPIPEPSAACVGLVALGAIALRRRRR